MTLPSAPALLSPEQLSAARIGDEILRQVAARGADKSICPSEVARALMPDPAPWQRLMTKVRHAAVDLARQGHIDILRKGQPVAPVDDPEAIKGVIRLRLR